MTGTRLPAATDELTIPSGPNALRNRSFPGGRTTSTGYATFRGVRVDVYETHEWEKPAGRIRVGGHLPEEGVYRRDDDPRLDGATGWVDFGELDRFWLTRVTTHDEIDEATPMPGLMAQIDGADVGLVDTTGTVSQAGVPELQVIWLGTGEPSGEGWSPDGYGQFTTLVHRSRVAVACHVEWTAIWRDLTVQVAAIREGRAVIFAAHRGLPPFEVPEIVPRGTRSGGWSTVVPLAELSLRSWTLTERPLGTGVVAKCLGRLRGRSALVARAAAPRVNAAPAEPAPGSDLVVKRARGDTVTDDFALLTYSGSFWDWRVTVMESEVTDLRQVTATTTWQGKTHVVDGVNDERACMYLDRNTVDITETTPLVYTVSPVERTMLPVDSTFW